MCGAAKTMTSPNQLTSTIHQATVRLYENNGCVLKRESACLDLTDFLCVAKSCVALEVLVFQLTLKSDDETAVHLFDGATSVCPCRRSKENGAENASFSYPLPSDKKIVNTFIHATSTANSVGVTMSQADLAYSYNVLVDLGRRLFPRFYDMSEFNFALNRPKEFVVNKMAEHYLPCPSHLPLASREEFIMLTQSDSLKDYIFLEDWIEQEEKRVEGIAWFYSKKTPDDLLLRRYFAHLVINCSCNFSFFLIIFCHPGFCLANVTDMKKCVFFCRIRYVVADLDETRWHLVIQVKLRRICDEIFAEHRFLFDSGRAKSTSKITLLLSPENCALLGSSALSQKRVVGSLAARIIEPAIFETYGADRLLVVGGEWKTGDLSDGLDWKNNGSTAQKEAVFSGSAPRRVGTLIPKKRFANPDDQSPVLKKEHIALGGLTYVFYHFALCRYKPRRSKKRTERGQEVEDEEEAGEEEEGEQEEEEEEEEEEEPEVGPVAKRPRVSSGLGEFVTVPAPPLPAPRPVAPVPPAVPAPVVIDVIDLDEVPDRNDNTVVQLD